MSNQPQMLGYGYTPDNDESLTPKAGGKFGLNPGSFITKFAFNANVAKEGETPRCAIEIVIKVAEKEFKDWIGPITRVFDKDGQTITDNTSAEFINAYNREIVQQRALMTHYLKALGVTEEAQAAALATPPTSFQDYAQRLCSLIAPGYENRPVDVFLEYQYNFGTKQDGTKYDKTFPTLPKNMKGGYFIVPAQPGIWTPATTNDGGLSYVNSNGQKHPIEKSADFMAGNKGTQQVADGAQGNPATAAFNANPLAAPGNGASGAAAWTKPQGS